ncbi:MAG: hypothetical protein PHT00_00265, partial [Candidatus Methanomethylophilus sp.]|nr:hypothetical protein [Methanomethylophilus sp.]
MAETIRTYLKWRAETVASAQRLKPQPEPEQLLIYSRYVWHPLLGGYSEGGTGYDKRFIAPLCARSKVQFANHTLRRTFGRTLWLAKTRVETIASILGHEDLRTTVKYL